jgi:HEAT repeat protein
MPAAALAAALAAAWPVAPAPAQQPPPPPGSPSATAAPSTADSTPIDISRAVAETINFDDQGLRRGGANPADREEAARRLIGRQSERVDTVVHTAVLNNPLSLQAVAHVLPEDPTPDPRLINPLRSLLASKSESVVQDAARALASYHDQPAALQMVIDFLTFPGPNAPEPPLRAAAARGLAASTDPRAAGLLVALLRDLRQPAVVRTAASDALIAMTGLRAYGQDPAAWQRWWIDNANKTPDRFKADLLDQGRRPRLQPADVLPFLEGLYRTTAKPEAKPEFLVQSLSAPDPATRGAAVLLAGKEFDTTGTLAGTIKTRLRELVRDGSPEVRQLVAQTLFRINDQLALVPLLAQLDQEPDPTVRVEQIRAVAQIGDPRAVPKLLALLDDTAAPNVAAAAAAALGARDLVPVIRRNPALLAQVRIALMSKIGDPNAPNARPAPAPEPVRSACIEALGQVNLKDPGLEPLLIGLLNPNEPAAVRRASLQALAVLGNDRTTEAIKRMTRDPDRDVRLAALNALGSVARFSAVNETLLNIFGPGATMEPDPVVRDAAWNTFRKLLPTADELLLIEWANQKFPTKPDYKVVMLDALADKQQKAGKLQDLALTWQNIGDALIKITPRNPDKMEQAAQFFGKALDYWFNNGGVQTTIDSLMQSKEHALLDARRYPEAVKFAQEMSAKDGSYQQKIGALLPQEAENLVELRDYKNAHDLAVEALKMPNDLLAPRFRARLEKTRMDTEDMLRKAPPPR